MSGKKPRNPILLALGHKSRVGKNEFIQHVARKYGKKYCVCDLYFANPLKELVEQVQKFLRVPIEKDRQLLRGLGMLTRDIYGSDVWIKKLETSLDEAFLVADIIIVGDCRFRNEMEYLQKRGFRTVRIKRDTGDEILHETDLDGVRFDHSIKNNGSLREYYEKIDQLLTKYL